MKKIILVSIVAIITLGLLSCKKEKDKNIAPKEVIRILMSAPNGKTDLKSAEVSQNKAIAVGDTVDVQDILDINIIIYAEDEFGLPIDGSWSIFNIDNDRNINQSDTIAIGDGGCGALGSALSTKLKFFGLYKVNFTSKAGTEIPFYIRHKGLPGIFGDDWRNEYVFRLDKEIYQISNAQGYKGYTLYLKFSEGEFPILDDSEATDLNLPKNQHALLYCGGNNIFISKGGFNYSAKEFSLKKCKYSPGYVCFSFVSDFTPPINGKYSIYFYAGTFGDNWWSFKSVRESDWSLGDQIVFQTIN